MQSETTGSMKSVQGEEKKRTIKRRVEGKVAPSARRDRHRFDMLKGDQDAALWVEVEMNAVELVQEVVDGTVDSGAAKSVWLVRRWSKKSAKLAAANESASRVWR